MTPAFPTEINDEIAELQRELRLRRLPPWSVRLRGERVVRIDQRDLWLMTAFNWRVRESGVLRKTYYLSARRSGCNFHIHRLIAGAHDGEFVDHINGDGLDNRRLNLRIATKLQNNRNRGPNGTVRRYRGTSFHPCSGFWRARIDEDAQCSYHETEEAAALAWDAMARSRHGEFAWQNFPGPDLSQAKADRQVAVLESAIESLHRLKALEK